MIIKSIYYLKFKLKLHNSFNYGTKKISSKSGYYIIIMDELGNASLGEASPLKEFSKESLKKVKQDLIQIKNELRIINLSTDRYFDKNNICASVRFGIESAILNLLIKRKEIKISPNKSVSVNAVVDLKSKNYILNNIKELVVNKYSTVKIKIGRKNFSDDFEIIKSIKGVFGNKLKIRADVNSSWNKRVAIKNINALNKFNLEYIEDPCKSLSDNFEVSKKSKTPIALDKPINNLATLRKLIKDKTINFLVIKPMIIGSVFELIKMIKLANKKKIKIIISSSFETKVGLKTLSMLSTFVNHNYAHGLSASNYINNQKSQNALNIICGKIKLSNLFTNAN
ncbi:MAG: o-succinylbenzoate synthase [Bacteroidetes bacterium]|nr:o-succinylbenzoate synthase [Bacteroidota bacterium]